MKFSNFKRLVDFVGLLRYEEKREAVHRFESERDLSTGAKKPEKAKSK